MYFPDGITVNSGGLQYNERNYADNENHAKEHNPICPFWNDYAADILYIVSEARYWQNYNRNPADDCKEHFLRCFAVCILCQCRGYYDLVFIVCFGQFMQSTAVCQLLFYRFLLFRHYSVRYWRTASFII